MDDLLSEGITLMVTGMGFVFVFLTLLVFATKSMSRVVMALAPEQTFPPNPDGTGQQPRHIADPHLVAVISAAIHKHRSRHK